MAWTPHHVLLRRFHRASSQSSWSAARRVPSRPFLRVLSTHSPDRTLHVTLPNAQNTSSSPYPFRMEDYPCRLIRNFSIIAHIDHGKSTLADRLLEMTNTITKASGANQQVLDKLKVERERGITVKAQTATMKYTNKIDGFTYLLNLIDTPGHVDFSWEVSRSLNASEGAILLVDSTQGVQAQTMSVYHTAKAKGLKIVPVLNKVDLPAADPERVTAQLVSIFDISPDDVIHISAKTGFGVQGVIDAVLSRIPAPTGSEALPLRARLFDSSYDRFRGVISLLRIQDGVLKRGDKIASCHSRKKYDVIEVGVLHPEETKTDALRPGQVGYLACNMKESSEAYIGDTFYHLGNVVDPLPGFQATKPMVYAGVFPVDSNDFPKLEESIKRLILTDRSVTIQRESSSALGQGCRLGFLGSLHMSVFCQRLEDEYDANVIVTAPTVPYKVVRHDKTTKFVSNPTEFPEYGDFKVSHVEEPFVRATIIVSQEYLGNMMELCSEHRGEEIAHRFFDISSDFSDSARIVLTCKLPLSEIVTDFFDKLKGRSSGFATFDYEEAGYERSPLSKMTFLLNQRPVDALAMVVHKSAHEAVGRAWAKRLKEVIPRQLFEVPIQAVVNNKVVSRETISAARKDVTAPLYGGDFTRKKKLLEQQKRGKKNLKRVGKVDLPQEAFFSLLRK